MRGSVEQSHAVLAEANPPVLPSFPSLPMLTPRKPQLMPHASLLDPVLR